jgi:hypothetical protein
MADIPSKFLARLGDLQWSETDMAWVDAIGVSRARYQETDEGFHRDRVLMVDEKALGQLLNDHELVLAVGLFSERRVFDRERRSIPKALGWVDYVGHLLFDGRTWDSVELHPFERHASPEDDEDDDS